MSTPHTAALRHALKGTQQRLRMAYVPVLRLPLIPESLIDAAGGVVAELLLTATGLSPAHAHRDISALRAVGPTGALNWYRALGTESRAFRAGQPSGSARVGRPRPRLHARSDRAHGGALHRRLPPPRARGRLALDPRRALGRCRRPLPGHLAATRSPPAAEARVSGIEVTGTAQRRSWECAGTARRRAGPPGTLVGPGATPEQSAALRARLSARGWTTVRGHRHRAGAPRRPGRAGRRHGGGRVRAEDVRAILITHIHPDHYGLAGRFREASGALDRAPSGRCGADPGAIRQRVEAPAREHGCAARRRRCARGDSAELTVASMGVREFVAAAEPDVLLEDRAAVPLPGPRAGHPAPSATSSPLPARRR